MASRCMICVCDRVMEEKEEAKKMQSKAIIVYNFVILVYIEVNVKGMELFFINYCTAICCEKPVSLFHFE